MKVLSFCCFIFLLVFQSCLTIEENSAVVSFWTDSVIDSETEYALYINDEPVGLITKRYEDAICNMIGLINVEIKDHQDMNLKIKDSKGSIVDVGIVNLSAPSTGITVKPNGEDSIFVTHDIDDPCTLVRLRW